MNFSNNSKLHEMAAAVFFGLLFVSGYINNSIYPIFVNALTNIPNLQSVSIGNLATAEFLAFGVVILLAGRFLPARNLRLIGGACLITHLFMAYGMTILPLELLLASRVLYGIASGMLIWIAYTYVARSNKPGQLVAIYLTCMMVTGMLWSMLATSFVIPLFGYSAIFIFLSSLSLVALVLLGLCPNDLASKAEKIKEQKSVTGGGLSLSSLLILASAGLWGFFMTIFWVYSDTYAQTLPGELVKHWLPVSLSCQFAGAILSASLVKRLPLVTTIAIGLGIHVFQVVSILMGVEGLGFVIWAGIYGFLGQFLVAFYVETLSRKDSTNRAVTYFPGVQMLCASLGPMFVAAVVSESDLVAVFTIDLVAICVAPLVLLLGVMLYKRGAAHRLAVQAGAID